MDKLQACSGPPSVAPPDRRRNLRVQVNVQIELRTSGSDVPMRLQTTDLSGGGCYVEMALTLDVGTKVDIVLWLDQQKLTLRGVIVTRHPQFGNGIEFLGMSLENERKLYCYLDSHESTWQTHTSDS